MSERTTSHEHINEKPLSQSELETSVDALSSDEVVIITGARIDTMLLDLEENPAKAGESFAERKSEIVAALEIVNTTKPDDEKGLSVSGVIDERIKIMKNAIEKDPSNAKLWEPRLAALELANGVLSEVFWESSNKLVAITDRLQKRGKLTDELYQDHQQAINSDARHDHNSRVGENQKRRKLIEQRNMIAGIKTRS